MGISLLNRGKTYDASLGMYPLARVETVRYNLARTSACANKVDGYPNERLNTDIFK